MFFRIVGVCLIDIWLGVVSAAAQTVSPPTTEPEPTPEQITAAIQEVDAATDLDDAKKASIKQLYQQAAAALEAMTKATADVSRFEAMIQNAAPNLQTVTEQLKNLPKQPPALPDLLTLPQLQQQLAETEAEVSRSREELTNLNGEVAARQLRQREVPVELDAARKQLADVNAQLATAAPDTEHPLLTRARRTNLLAQAASLTSRISALEKELPAYAATAELLPKQRDLAGQKLSSAEKTRQVVLDRIDRLRRTDVGLQVEEAKRAWEQTPDEIKSIAKMTLDYTTKNQAILQELKQTADSRAETEGILDGVKQEFQGTREKVETVGLTDALGIFLRTKRSDLASVRGKHHADRTRRATVQELQLQLLQLEDARTDLTQMDVATTNALEALRLDAGDEQLRTQVRKVLESQRDALDSLLQNQQAYFESLVALDSAERELVQQIDESTAYIEGWILWVRSAPPLGWSELRDVFERNALEAAHSWSNPSKWLDLATTVISIFRGRLLLSIVFAVAFVGLVLRQRSLRRQLRELGTRAEPRSCREFAPTAEAAVLTLAIAAVWPTLL